jgi:lipoyl(octanoyl) transferase
MPLEILDWTTQPPVSYREAWEWQLRQVELRQRGEVPDTLVLLTHPAVITYGKMSHPAHRLLSETEYTQRGIERVATDRGGDVTYHGPGQLVGYPVVHLGEGNRDLHRYVRFLEQVLIETCNQWQGVCAERADWHAGVWSGNGYLAALGVRVTRWVTYHGFALNVTEEVRSGFATIVPCGVPNKEIATLEQLSGQPLTVQTVAQGVSEEFHRQWKAFSLDRTTPPEL